MTIHLILITRNQSSPSFRSKAHNFVVICDSYIQACERIQEYLDSEYIHFDKESVYKDWFEDNVEEEFFNDIDKVSELFKKYYSEYYFDKEKGYKTQTGYLVDVSYDENGLVTGYFYDTKQCGYDSIELDTNVYDYLIENFKTYEIENLFNNYINLANISGLHKTDIIAYLNTELAEYYMQDVYSDVMSDEEMYKEQDLSIEDIQELTDSEFQKMVEFKEDSVDSLNEDIKKLPNYNQD